MAEVTWTSGGAAKTLLLDGNLVVIGRDPSCALVLEGADVSPVHCELRQGPDGWRVVDLESRAGTRVNGEFVNTKSLRDGDVVDAGGVQITFRGDAGRAAGAPAATTAARAAPSRTAPAAAPSSKTAAPRPAVRPAKTSRSAPPARAGRTGAARAADAGQDGDQARPERRAGKQPDKASTRMLMVAGGIGMILVLWLIFHMLGSSTPNHQLRMQMTAAESAMDYQRAIDLSAQMEEDGTNDPVEMKKIVARCRKALEAQATGGKLDQSLKDWMRLAVWHQQNPKATDEYVTRIDQFLTTYADIESEGTKQARAARVKVAGTSAVAGAPTTGDAGWRTTIVDVHAMEEEGRFGAALAKIDAWWKENGSASPTLIAPVEAEKKRLLTAADKWFSKQVALAARDYFDFGAKNKARQRLEKAGDEIGLPGYPERAAEEWQKISSGAK